MPLSPALRAVMAKANKIHGPGTIISGSEIAKIERKTISSGSLSLDIALGGGFAVNHFVEIVGRRSAGKTYSLLKMIAENQRRDPNWTVIWIASEDFHDPYAEMLGVDLSRLILIDTNILEVAFNEILRFVDTHEIDCVVVDSIAALISESENEAKVGEIKVGRRALVTNNFFAKANKVVKRQLSNNDQRPVTVFVVNHFRNTIGQYGNPLTTPGGMAKDYHYFQQVEIRRDGWLKNTKGHPIGQTMKFVITKNKYAPPLRVATVDAYFETKNGIQAGSYDVSKDIMEAVLAYEIVSQSGAFFTFDGERWKGRAALMAAIKSDSKLRNKLRQAALKKASGREDSPATPGGRTRTGSSEKTVSKTAPRKRDGEQDTRHAHSNRTNRVQNSPQRKQANNHQVISAAPASKERSNRGSTRTSHAHRS